MIKVEAENVQDLVSKLGVIFQAVLDKFPDKYQDFPDFLKDVEVIGMSAIDVHSAISMLVEFDWKKFNKKTARNPPLLSKVKVAG